MNDKLTLERWIADQDCSRNKDLYKTNERYKQIDFIRNHLGDVLLHKFDWHYWITINFGWKPYMDECEDVLYKLHHRIDQRILKHIKEKSVMKEDERSEWIMFPEIARHGLHYHGFLKLNTFPNIMKGYENTWEWLNTAFYQTLSNMNDMISTLGNNERLERYFALYKRSFRKNDNLKMIVYSMKQYGKNDFDRFNHTIISHMDWKPKPIYQRRTPNKISAIESRPNKITDKGTLLSFGV